MKMSRYLLFGFKLVFRTSCSLHPLFCLHTLIHEKTQVARIGLKLSSPLAIVIRSLR